MNAQINIRMSEDLLEAAKTYAKENGFGTVQDFVRETVRQKLFDTDITRNELNLVKKLVQASKKKDFFGTEDDLVAVLKRNV